MIFTLTGSFLLSFVSVPLDMPTTSSKSVFFISFSTRVFHNGLYDINSIPPFFYIIAIAFCKINLKYCKYRIISYIPRNMSLMLCFLVVFPLVNPLTAFDKKYQNAYGNRHQ